MASKREFALEISRVQKLDCVSQVISAANEPFVCVEWAVDLIALLPPNRCVLRVNRADFSVQFVIAQYEEIVVEHLVRAADLAQALLKSSKQQAKK